jgi:hypothetical protein
VYIKINNNTGMTGQVHTGPLEDNCTFCMENGMIIITPGMAFSNFGNSD